MLHYFKFVSALRPRVFLMENVPGMLWPRHGRFLERLKRFGRALGYDVRAPKTLDARDYGVPQRRKRVFVLGVRADIEIPEEWWPSPTHGDERARAENRMLKEWEPAGVVFDRPFPTGDENGVHMNHCDALVEVFKSTPLNGGTRRQSGRTLACHEGHEGHNDVYGRIDPAEPGPTMTTACINPSKGRFVHPTEHHGITVRQAARFQTFPDDFVFKGGLIAAGEQVGNAVPIELGRALLKQIAAHLRANSETAALQRAAAE